MRPLTEAQRACRAELGRVCSSGKCQEPVTHTTSYRYVSGQGGRVTYADRDVCTAHARRFASKHGLTLDGGEAGE